MKSHTLAFILGSAFLTCFVLSRYENPTLIWGSSMFLLSVIYCSFDLALAIIDHYAEEPRNNEGII